MVTGLAVSGGEVYVCDQQNFRMVVFGLDGSFVRQWGTEGFPEGVAVNGDEVLVTDSDNLVQVFGVDGSFVELWGDPDGGLGVGAGGGAGQFDVPYGIAVSEGEVFVSSRHCVQVFQ